MPVKHWTFAGLLLTYRCNARCASCYVCSGPEAVGDMSVETGLTLWEGLIAASPHGCRIHIGGGEPFVCWETLIELVCRARAAGLGPLEAVETNAFWATDERTVRDRLAALDAAGMGRLAISADPYHQQFVPIERARLAARVAEELLGRERVRVRWRDWLETGFDADRLDGPGRREVFAAWAARGRDRMAGRAAEMLAGLLPLSPPGAFADSPCGDRLLRSRHVHADGDGALCPGTCAGIVLGRLTDAASVGAVWSDLAGRFAEPPAASGMGPLSSPGHAEAADSRTGRQRLSVPPEASDVLGLLVRGGPVALMYQAVELGFRPRSQGYSGKCHLCCDVRRWMFGSGIGGIQLGPANVYEP